MEWENEFGVVLSVDKEGHKHKGKGPHGGEFTSSSEKSGGEVTSQKSKNKLTAAKLAASFVFRWSWKGVNSLPPIAVQDIFKQTRPNGPIVLYRFERKDHDPLMAQMGSKVPLQSWTSNKATAHGIAEAMNDDAEKGVEYIVKERIFQPHEVYVDFGKLPSDVKSYIAEMGGQSNMDEVLVYNFPKSREDVSMSLDTHGVLYECLLDCNGDIEAAFAAAEAILSEHDVSKEKRDEEGKWTNGGGKVNLLGNTNIPPHDSWEELEADPRYIYHATNQDNAQVIAEGHLEPHKPWEGTDQEVWPDGSTHRRSYFTDSPADAWKFAPENGKPVLLRIVRTAIPIKRESTGDLYTRAKIPAHRIEVYTTHGWLPLTTKMEGEDKPLSINAFLAHDIHNRRAQGILNRTLKASKGLSVAARKDLAAALESKDSGEAILKFVDKYRVQLGKLLTTTQLASILKGASEVSEKMPTLATFPGAIPPPPTLEPKEAVALVEKLEQLTAEKQAEEIIKRPPAEQAYIKQAIAARAAPPPVIPPIVRPPSPAAADSDDPEEVHLVTIDEAVRSLAERNVMDRQSYDALNAAARAKAFTIANVQAEETLTKIRDSLAENVREGVDYETWRKKIMDDVDQGTFLSDAHTETIFRTTVQSGFSDGQEMVLSHPLVRSGFPYRARDAIHDDRVREDHLALETMGIGGTNIYRADDPVWQMFRVPWDYNDRCADTPMTIRQAAEAGIQEAQIWLETGVEPAAKAHVPMPPFRPPPGFQRAAAAAPLSIRLSMQSVAAFAEHDVRRSGHSSELLSVNVALGGQPEHGGSNRQWITIGGESDPKTGEKHVGGFRVLIDGSGRILKGRMLGKKVKDVKTAFDRKNSKERRSGKRPAERPSSSRSGGGVGQRGGKPPGQPEGISEPLAGKAPKPGGAGAGAPEENTHQPVGAKAPETAVGRRAAEREAREQLKRLSRRLERYKNVLAKKGGSAVAGWIDELKSQLQSAGLDHAVEALGEAKLPSPSASKVQYEGAHEEIGSSQQEADFIKRYLDHSGITLVQSTSTLDQNAQYISSFSEKNLQELKREGRTRGGVNYIPSDATFKNKLEESQHLPGLESSEDIDKIVGHKVTQFTPDVTAAFDAKYGKGKWIVKSYGEEAYAGFGIFFPQRIKQIQRDAKAVVQNAKGRLKESGYKVVRDEDGTAVGVSKGSQIYHFHTPEMDALDKRAKVIAKQIQQAAHAENGAHLPTSPEDTIRNNYGVSLRRNDQGVPIGITDWTGKDYDFGTDAYKKIEAEEGGSKGYEIHRAVEADEWRREGFSTEPKFMVQPAFPAIGVSEMDRAYGATWETAKEGRVHTITRDGKASAIPYATLVGRGDQLPAVVQSPDVLAMQKAVEDAINNLPESERSGQMYAPDVMKTKDGWKVIELNPSAVGGGSNWLGENPFVIDAMVSHITSREPQHVKFVRDLLRKSGVKMPPAPTPPTPAAMSVEDQPRRPPGIPEGGQFARGSAGGGGVHVVRHGSLKSKFSVHVNKRIKGPKIPLKNYRQRDTHSCGFVAAMTVARYLAPGTSAKDILKTVRPTKSGGIDRRDLTKALGKLGIKAKYANNLSINKLRRHVENGTPVLVSVYPDDWAADHWTVVQGFDEDRIYLTNYKSLPIKQFMREWYDKGEGLIAYKADDVRLSTDAEGHEHRGKSKGGGSDADDTNKDNEELYQHWRRVLRGE